MSKAAVHTAAVSKVKAAVEIHQGRLIRAPRDSRRVEKKSVSDGKGGWTDASGDAGWKAGQKLAKRPEEGDDP